VEVLSVLDEEVHGSDRLFAAHPDRRERLSRLDSELHPHIAEPRAAPDGDIAAGANSRGPADRTCRACKRADLLDGDVVRVSDTIETSTVRERSDERIELRDRFAASAPEGSTPRARRRDATLLSARVGEPFGEPI
jgi:hypothetical protein